VYDIYKLALSAIWYLKTWMAFHLKSPVSNAPTPRCYMLGNYSDQEAKKTWNVNETI